MPLRLNTRDAGFESAFTAFLSMKREVSQDVDDIVRDIIGQVIARGDEALVELSAKFDRIDLTTARNKANENLQLMASTAATWLK